MAFPSPSVATSESAKRRTNWWTLLFKISIVAVILWAVRSTLLSAISQLRRHELSIDYAWLVAAGLLYLVSLLPCAWFWRRVLRTLGQSPHWGELLRAYYIGHLGKYVPGKAMVIVLRTGLIRSQRVQTSVAALSVLYETLTMMAVGAFLACGVLMIYFRDQTFLMLVAAGLMIAAGIPTIPPVFRRLARLMKVGRNSPELADRLASFSLGTLVVGWIGIAGGWCLMAVSLWAVLRSMGATTAGPLENFTLLLAAVSLSMVAGFLSLIPGGALVRESVLLELLERPYGEGDALAAAILLRLVWLVSELAISVIMYACRRRGAETPADPPSDSQGVSPAEEDHSVPPAR